MSQDKSNIYLILLKSDIALGLADKRLDLLNKGTSPESEEDFVEFLGNVRNCVDNLGHISKTTEGYLSAQDKIKKLVLKENELKEAYYSLLGKLREQHDYDLDDEEILFLDESDIPSVQDFERSKKRLEEWFDDPNNGSDLEIE